MDQDDNERVAERQQEGVRIVGRDQAQSAIDAGEVITRATRGSQGRRPIESSESSESSESDEPRPTLSFPLPDSQSAPQVVMRPKLAARPVTAISGDEGAEVLDLRSFESGSQENGVDSDSYADQSASTSITNLPHWTEPPVSDISVAGGDVDLDSTSTQPRWRDTHAGGPASDISYEDLRVASGLGRGRAKSDVGNDDADPDDLIDESVLGQHAPRGEKLREVNQNMDEDAESSTKGGNRFREPSVLETAKTKLGTASFARRVVTAAVFAAVALVAFALGPAATLLLASVVIIFAAVEYFDAMRRSGYRPATVLALVGIAGLMFGTYARGESAIVLVVALTALFTFAWYLSGVIRTNPTANVATTLLGVVWIGVLGSFGALLLRMPDRHGMAFVIAAVVCTVVYDSSAYIGGNVIGRTPLARQISPHKTWEGLVVGTIASVVVGGLIGSMMHPWSLASGLALGVLVAVVSPIGDLAESMVKRDLGLKDMGHILPGHGGALDRFDALLLVLPATYYLVVGLNIGQ